MVGREGGAVEGGFILLAPNICLGYFFLATNIFLCNFWALDIFLDNLFGHK